MFHVERHGKAPFPPVAWFDEQDAASLTRPSQDGMLRPMNYPQVFWQLT